MTTRDQKGRYTFADTNSLLLAIVTSRDKTRMPVRSKRDDPLPNQENNDLLRRIAHNSAADNAEALRRALQGDNLNEMKENN